MTEIDRTHMERAISLADQCKPKEERIPRVGAVIALGEGILGRGHRGTGNPGDDDHAEKRALDQIADKTQLPQATLYTTLEPCTREVRSQPLNCCTELIKQHAIKRVFIGILDPNQGVRGKGLWELQMHGVDVELFPPDLAKRILALNRDFIRVQQTVGIQFTNLESGQLIRTYDKKGVYEVQGTFLNPPGDNVFAFTGTGGQWWPQPDSLRVTGDKEWAVKIHFGDYGRHTVCIVQTSDLGKDLVYYFRKVVRRNQRLKRLAEDYFKKTGTQRPEADELLRELEYAYTGIDLGALPKGIETLATVEIKVEHPPVTGFTMKQTS
jgi:pyrimidine deaminase RibD-like protein